LHFFDVGITEISVQHSEILHRSGENVIGTKSAVTEADVLIGGRFAAIPLTLDIYFACHSIY